LRLGLMLTRADLGRPGLGAFFLALAMRITGIGAAPASGSAPASQLARYLLINVAQPLQLQPYIDARAASNP
jgi:hypothetical protein